MSYFDIFKKVVNEINETSNRKENFRLLHKKATTINEDVMNRFYGIKSNKNKPVRIDEISLERIKTKHGQNGLICISANRSDMPKERNDVKTRELINDLKISGYRYLPTYGGYRSQNGIEDDYEPSFIVFNYTTDGKSHNFNELYKFALQLCDKYEQDSVLIKSPDNNPIWVDKDGNKVNTRESDNFFKNDAKQEYFTSLKDKDAVNDEVFIKMRAKYKSYCQRKGIKPTEDGFKNFYDQNVGNIKKIGKRFTYDISFDECYVNPMPCQLSERMRRQGEIMIWE